MDSLRATQRLLFYIFGFMSIIGGIAHFKDDYFSIIFFIIGIVLIFMGMSWKRQY